MNIGGLTAACVGSINGSSVSVTLILNNNSGIQITNVVADAPQINSTGSAVVSLGSANPSRYSQIDSGNSGRFRWTGTQSGSGESSITLSAHADVNGTAVTTSVTCDPLTSAAIPTATPRLAHTPVPPLPTRTVPPTPGINPGAFSAVCHALQVDNNVTILLTVSNNTGAAATSVQPQGPNVSDAGGGGADVGGAAATLNISVGPAPVIYSLVADGNRATFRWSGQLTGAGDVLISASATGIGQGGAALSTGVVDCGTVGAVVPPPPAFDVNGLIGLCVATVVDGKLLVSFRLELSNVTGGDLTNVTPFLSDVQTTGNAVMSVTNEPHSLNSLRADHRNFFKWQGQAQGRGLAFIHVGATATGPGGEAVTTGVIECNTLVLPPRP